MATTAVRPTGTAAVVGGVLWALLPVIFTATHLDDIQRGTLAFVAVAAAYWVFGVLPMLLLLAGLGGLRGALADGVGRLGTAGIVVSGLALLAMFLGNGTEMATITASGAESDIGHSVFLIGFLALVVGSLLLGIALLRGRPGALVRWAAVLLVAMLPVGFGLGVGLNAVSPHTDLGFWAAITVDYGVAWVLLGRWLSASRETRVTAPAPVS